MLPRIAKVISPLLLLSSLSAFAEVSPQTESNTIKAFMNTFMQAYEKKDLNALVQFYEPNAVVIGTGKDEIIQGQDQIRAAFKRDFEQHSTAKVDMTPIAINVEKNVAFASYNLMVNVQLPDAKTFQAPLRFSVGLIKQDNAWHIIQSHLSAPLAGQEEGQSFPKT